MLILAIDTSAKHYSLALLDDDSPIAEFDSRLVESSRQPSQSGSVGGKGGRTLAPGVSVTLIPAISNLFERTRFSLDDIDSISVAVGPGMFTGLRVGVVAAKTLAYVKQVPLLGVNTLEVIAAQSAIDSEDKPAVIHAVLNAQRQQLFAGTYQSVEPWRVTQFAPNAILERDTWIAGLSDGDLVAGPGLRPLIPQLNHLLDSDRSFKIAAESSWECTALGVGLVGREYLLAGRRDDLWKMEPFYFRPSAAEEVFAEKLRAGPKT